MFNQSYGVHITPLAITSLGGGHTNTHIYRRPTPYLAILTQPLCMLLGKNYQCDWESNQDAVFTAVKQELTAPTVLTLYDPNADTKVSEDSSSF